jgi:replication factor C large subunit
MLSESRSQLWIIKHKPRRIEDIVGNEEAKEEYLEWLNIWLKGKPPIKKAVLIYGPPGIGKTLLVEVSAIQYNLELLELNAGDLEGSETIRKIALPFSSEESLERRKKLILIDEIDSIEGSKAPTILKSISDLIDQTKYPIALIANDAWNPELWQIRNKALMIEMKKLSSKQIISYLEKICKIENISYEFDALKIIAERASGDMRSAIIDLQIASIFGKIGLKEVNIAGAKDRQTDVFSVIRHIIYATTVSSARKAVDEYAYDPETLMLWIEENIHKFYTKYEDLELAYSRLAKADYYRTLANKKRMWRFLLYFLEMMTAGVALSKSTKPTYSKIEFPEILRLMSRQRKANDLRSIIISEIAKKCHMSMRKANTEMFWFLLLMLKNEEFKSKIYKKMGWNEDIQGYLNNLSQNLHIKAS